MFRWLSRVIRTIEIPWEDVRMEFSWTASYWGEGHVRTYLLKHPQIIDPSPELVLLGVEAGTRDGDKVISSSEPAMTFIDLLYKRGEAYYVVETEKSTDEETRGAKEARYKAKRLEEFMQTGRSAIVIPVFAG